MSVAGPSVGVVLVAASLAAAPAIAASADAPVLAASTDAPVVAASTDAAALSRSLEALEAAWQAKDAAAYLALWRFPDAETQRQELDFARRCFAAGEALLSLPRPERPPEDPRIALPADLALVDEPRGRLERHRFVFEALGEGWRIVERSQDARVDGLLHLSLDSAGFRADGLSIELEDFSLSFHHGTLFLPPESVGPTVLVFVGEATVRFAPRPAVEQGELERFAGDRELEDRVRRVFVRLHPADLHRLLRPMRLEPDPDAARRVEDAERFYARHVGEAFLLDASAPGSPWWVLPALRDASVTFETRRHGTLTFAVENASPESLTLFDAARRLQICRYPARAQPARFDEDAGRAIDVLDHDITARFEPDSHQLEARDTLRLRLLQPTRTLTLQLAESLDVRAVTSATGQELLFFRIPHQRSILVALGEGPGTGEPTEVTVHYGGRLEPEPVEREALQVVDGAESAPLHRLLLDRVHVFTGRTLWYPHPGNDYATATVRFEVPAGLAAVGGGRLVARMEVAGRERFHYRQDRPGRYAGLAVGRLRPVDRRGEAFEAWAVPRLEGEARRVLDQAVRIVDFFTGEFGPMPYASLRLALIEGATPGGHSPPGLVLLQERPAFFRRGLREDPAGFHDVPGFFLAHEVAHQWWGHGVAGENYHERWLSEAVAQYAAASWTRHEHGEQRFGEVLERLGRWAQRMTDRGPISLGHRLGHVEGDPQVFRAVVYDKGAYVLHMLRGVVGPEAFRSALGALQQSRRFEKVGTADLQRALEEASGRSLAAYLDAWVDGTEIIELDWWLDVRRVDDRYRTRVTVRPRHVPGPVPLEISYEMEGSREARVVELDTSGGTFTFETAAKPRRVELNRDGGLLAIVRKR